MPYFTNRGIVPLVVAAAADAVRFDGNDSLNRGGALTGLADGKVGLVSFWFRFKGTSGANEVIFEDQDVYVSLRKTNADQWSMVGANSVGSTILNLSGVAAGLPVPGTVWQHAACWWDLAATSGDWYVDGTLATTGVPTRTNDTINYAGPTDYHIGQRPGGTLRLNCEIYDLYINFAETLDLSNSANLQKFRSAGGNPVSLGATGQTPTGNAPIMFFSGPLATWNTNLGTGGGFSVANGALSAAPNIPP